LQVTVGRIGRPHGIRGDVVVGVRTDEPELRFAKGSRLDTAPAKLGPLTVLGSKWHSGELLVRFEGISDRDAAAELRGTWVLVDSASIAPPDDPDEFHDTDLIGLSVRTVGGAAVGIVDDVLHSGQDVLVVKTADGSDVMVPFVLPIVPEVDVASGFLVINPPEGLLDLENSLLSVGCGRAGRSSGVTCAGRQGLVACGSISSPFSRITLDPSARTAGSASPGLLASH